MNTSFRFSLQDIMDVAAKKIGIPDWQGYQWEAVSDRQGDYDSIVTGCVPDGVYSKGPRKGSPRFSFPKHGTKRTAIVTTAELVPIAAEYESQGRCWDCKGSGKTIASVHITEGTTYRDCSRCKGTGKPA